MANAQVIDFSARQQSDALDGQFLTLIDSDMAGNPHHVRPLSAALLQELQAFCDEAETCDQHELLQG
ncbi:hypothetical protein QYG59_18245 [Xanthomonas perforans]|uniref:hypothetical protein n=1 Tax=Xanthomonas perforans TaxID=442694 RepID=UPI0032B6036E